MKTAILFILLFGGIMYEIDESVHDFKLNSIQGQEVDLSEFEGHLLLIVNTASECGFTPQYEGIQALYDTYRDQNFYVLGFPANNFGGQESGSDDDILEFCEVNFGVNFPLFSKISVKGEDIHPLFRYLTTAENSDFTGDIGWNFEKFLVDRNGKMLRRFKSNVAPDSAEMVGAIEQAL